MRCVGIFLIYKCRKPDIMKKVAQMQHEAELRNEKKETDISDRKEDLLYN